MPPRKFYRVEDEDSSACYIDGRGIFAGDRDTPVDFRGNGAALKRQVRRHLDWDNRYPTPFIPTYCKKWVALREAERRVTAGKKKVKIYTIDTRAGNTRTEYRNIRFLAKDKRV